MKEMIYQERLENPIILDEGDFENRHYCIISQGTHPTAYISLTELETKQSVDYDDYNDKADVHGGFTYLGKAYWNKNDKRTYVGWDYAHYGDFTYSLFSIFQWGEKYTTEFILDEVKNAIKQINKEQNNDK